MADVCAALRTKNNPTGCAEEFHRERGQCVMLKMNITGSSRRLTARALPDMVHDEYIGQRTHQQGTLSCYPRRLHRLENRPT
ncbi:uncharacterized protein LAESUDRAFT_726385 [Laetiporus sulphureus 93-53]|uniref:Uncharacterized protein n=1 Tax=Laetiporus sulphureus 93-53 TaxID=1314785 RepID=A0A165E3P4_9APHY|nr:uncharacterized protein LAESUDRAFT_726385 [Laetiporus sulphureus 93-53]KZT06192.1 hypothetical protein LAESUDRAFT_726385 [Laetiporus sulphureus 93-53]